MRRAVEPRGRLAAPSSVDCLRRGLANVGANWELVAVHWLGTVLWVAFFALGCLPPLAVLGVDLASFDLERPEGLARALEALPAFLSFTPALGLAFLATATLWLLALLAYCALQAGTFGVLIAGERQARAGLPKSRRVFRTFSSRDFLGWGGRYLWRFVGFVHLGLALVLFVALLAAIWLAVTALGGARWGTGAAFGLGCGGSLPLAFAVFLLSAWFYAAQADLAREGAGVGRSARQAFEVIGRRLGAVILFLVLSFFAFFGLFLVGSALSLAADAALAGRPLAKSVASFSITLASWIPQALIQLGLAGSFVALVRGEALRGQALESADAGGRSAALA